MTTQGTYQAERVLHWRRASRPASPWLGRPVLADAPSPKTLAGAVERSLTGELAVPVSRLAYFHYAGRLSPATKQSHDERFEAAHLPGDGSVAALTVDRGFEAAQPSGWRFGAEPDASSVELRDLLRRDVAAEFGVAPGLVWAESGSAQAMREVRSLWLRSRVMPALRDLAAVLAVAFDDPSVAFRLPLLELDAADTTSRQRQRRAASVAILRRAGYEPAAELPIADGGSPDAEPSDPPSDLPAD